MQVFRSLSAVLLISAVLLLAGAPTVDAQTTGCQTDAQSCGASLSPKCLGALGAGAAAAPPDCVQQLAAYRGCLSDVAERCAPESAGIISGLKPDEAAQILMALMPKGHEEGFHEIASYWGANALSNDQPFVETTLYNHSGGAIEDIRYLAWFEGARDGAALIDRRIAFLDKSAQRTLKGDPMKVETRQMIISCVTYRIGDERHARIDGLDAYDALRAGSTHTQLVKGRRSRFVKDADAAHCDALRESS